MAQSSSISLLCSSNPLSSPPKSSYSARFLNPSSTFSRIPCQWRLISLQPTHGLKVSSLQSTALSSASAAEEIIEENNGDLDFVEIGYVSNVHGLDGEIRVKHNTDFPDLRFGTPGKRWLRQQYSGRDEIVEVEIEEGRGHHGSKSWIVKLSGFDSVDQARQLVGATFLVRNIDRPELKEGEYYSRDLIGMRVVLKETGESVGTVVSVIDSGGNDLLQVLLEASTGSPDESTKQKSEKYESGHLVWIPFVEAIVPDVDMDKREMQITPPKGLLELNVRSNERSKKERRLIEWRERKKFQRRLISAKKKLCELDQQHIFHGLQYGEMSYRTLLAEQIVCVNLNLLQQALQAVEKPINGCNLGENMPDVASRKCGNSLKIPEKYLTNISIEKLDAYSEHGKTGVHLISKGKVATVLVLNNENPEKHLENGEDPTISHLKNLLSDKQTFIQAEQRESVSIIFISPVVEIQLLEKLFETHDYFTFSREKVRFLEEEKILVVSSSTVEQKNKVLMKSPWEVHQSSMGFGGTISALASNNILEDLIKSGVEYVEVCSISRSYLCGNPIFLGFVHSEETDIGLVTFDDKREVQDNFHVILPVKSMQKLVKQMEKLPLNAILKSYSHVELINKEWVDVIPSTPNSYEFHCSLQSLLDACSLDRVSLMEVTK
ncbi:uncharacterized protein LOC110728807 isoform X1 [Chenopodium quinoa]|uniref:uncharacterized protein LOC110728807 isoform X1 n=1 Tax=Chenopodium quinoa TaxID=63459 RepID=UPI000B77EDAC|nr:uncharacterized protein LOC110728807 isoform X1 [Chenopodium quinoa]